MAGRVALDREIQQVADVLNDPGYGRRDVQEIGGYRTLISAPLILDDEVVGAISLWRNQVEPFDDAHHRAAAGVRGAGGGRGPQRPPGPGPGGPAARARPARWSSSRR